MNQITTPGRIGIITGAGPDAGIDLWQKVLKHNKSLYKEHYQGDLSAPEVVVYSIPQLGLAMDIKSNEAILWQRLQEVLQRLNSQVDYVCIACNVLHYFSDKINQLKLNIEFISIVDVVENYIKKHGNVALLSISKVIEFGQYSPYAPSAKKYPLETPKPAAMDSLVSDIKRLGGEHPDTVAQFDEIVAQLQSDKLILACTDLPLLPLDKYHKEFVDASDMLAQALAEKAFHHC
ncbi:hypothetical protein PSECIP111951_02136 [Pseudoalteromonas holothuriae]|uniref:Aspartate racemase n=1 Tax=Pseudoalteromonas holothuriae TaxID=2963714 RepID=A0A9W4QS29_9GAMM|nr:MULTISPECIES: aspartate/glutamate racemase family protein [unclassified Pseudoalteromonas]CAH9050759.1 hypothetical protein PSECIP111854_00596 [Pseudoalteromonas sp. CIP111854]CAH9059764.1 hypothetical protein PSECIP111951_02136 [Pseudoalteromonas sp. CIP111951]